MYEGKYIIYKVLNYLTVHELAVKIANLKVLNHSLIGQISNYNLLLC